MSKPPPAQGTHDPGTRGPGTLDPSTRKVQLRPYADDAASVGIGKLTVENGRDKVSLYGSLDLTRDQAGLEQARALKALLDQVVQALEGDHDLPAQLPAQAKPGTVGNPFG